MTITIGRNDPCPCGSGKKYKQCCMSKPKPPRFKAKLLSQPKQIDLMSRTFGERIQAADQFIEGLEEKKSDES